MQSDHPLGGGPPSGDARHLVHRPAQGACDLLESLGGLHHPAERHHTGQVCRRRGEQGQARAKPIVAYAKQLEMPEGPRLPAEGRDDTAQQRAEPGRLRDGLAQHLAILHQHQGGAVVRLCCLAVIGGADQRAGE